MMNYCTRQDLHGLQRLTGVGKDSVLLRRYQYDPFGNRISMEAHEHGARSEFSYDILNRLSEERKYQSPAVSENQDAYKCIRYEYDKRGNLTGQYEGGTLLHGYAYNAMNRLERAWNRVGQKAVYSYNGSGQRTAEKKEGIREEDGDIYFNFGTELYIAIGGIDVELNISECS